MTELARTPVNPKQPILSRMLLGIGVLTVSFIVFLTVFNEWDPKSLFDGYLAPILSGPAVDFTSEDGSYAVTFPSEPTTSTQHETANGLDFTVTTTMWLGSNGRVLAVSAVPTAAIFPEGVSVADFTDEERDTFLENGRDRAVANVPDGKLVMERFIILDGVRAFELNMDSAAGEVGIISALHGDHLYSVAMTGMDDSTTAAFVASFHFLPAE